MALSQELKDLWAKVDAATTAAAARFQELLDRLKADTLTPQEKADRKTKIVRMIFEKKSEPVTSCQI